MLLRVERSKKSHRRRGLQESDLGARFVVAILHPHSRMSRLTTTFFFNSILNGKTDRQDK